MRGVGRSSRACREDFLDWESGRLAESTPWFEFSGCRRRPLERRVRSHPLPLTSEGLESRAAGHELRRCEHSRLPIQHTNRRR
jgi:hypothetical protein